MSLITNDFRYGQPDLIVDPVLGRGTHQTISAALITAAASGLPHIGIAIKQATYVEDLDIPANVHLWGYEGSLSAIVIQGMVTFLQEGSSTFTDITFKQNGSFLIDITGSNSGTAIFERCNLFYGDDTMIRWQNGDKNLALRNCSTHQGAEGLKYVHLTRGGQFTIFQCRHFNTFYSNFVSSTLIDGVLICSYSSFQPMSFHLTQFLSSGDSRAEFSYNQCSSASLSASLPFLLLDGTNVVQDRIRHNHFIGGGARVITINGTRNSDCSGNTVDTSAVAAIDGSGTVNYGSIEFLQPLNTITTTTQNAGNLVTGGISFDAGVNVLDEYEEGTFTPVLTGSTTPPDVMTATAAGKYTRVGNKVTIKIAIQLTSFTLGAGAGAAQITGLPFTSANDSPLSNVGPVFFHEVDYEANASLATVVNENTAYVRFTESVTNTAQGLVGIEDFAQGDLLRSEITYWI